MLIKNEWMLISNARGFSSTYRGGGKVELEDSLEEDDRGLRLETNRIPVDVKVTNEEEAIRFMRAMS